MTTVNKIITYRSISSRTRQCSVQDIDKLFSQNTLILTDRLLVENVSKLPTARKFYTLFLLMNLLDYRYIREIKIASLI